MNTSALPSLARGRLLTLVAPDSLLAALFAQVAALAQKGPLYVLDGGNLFQGYALARSLAAGDALPQRETALQRVLLARAFTCYQMVNLLTETPLEAYPVLVLDFLGTFYDQSVPVPDRRRLLQTCLGRLRLLSQAVPVAIWVRQRKVIPTEGLAFLEQVQRASGQVWRPEPRPAPAAYQPALFEPARFS